MKTNTWKNIVIGLLVLLNVAALSTIWFGQRTKYDRKGLLPQHGMPHERPEAGPRDPQNHPPVDFVMIEALGLDEQQTITFRDLKEGHHERSREIQDEVRKLKNDMFRAISSEDREKAERLSDEIGELQEEMEMLLFDHFSDIRAICNDAQQEEFDDMLTRIGERIHTGPPKGRGPMH